MPVTSKQYENLDDEQIEALDQFWIPGTSHGL